MCASPFQGDRLVTWTEDGVWGFYIVRRAPLEGPKPRENYTKLDSKATSGVMCLQGFMSK